MAIDTAVVSLLLKGLGETLVMVTASTVLGYAVGLPLGVLLAVTDKGGIAPRPALYRALDTVINVTRSVPFLILLVLMMPLTVLLVGKSYGTLGTIPPLTAAAAPFIARLVESSLKEVDRGAVEAARSMGAGNLSIITKVLIGEARTSLLVGVTIALGTILGYSAMAGFVGGGGLGDIAIRYGYYRWETTVMLITVAVLVVLMQLLQAAGAFLSKRIDRR